MGCGAELGHGGLTVVAQPGVPAGVWPALGFAEGSVQLLLNVG